MKNQWLNLRRKPNWKFNSIRYEIEEKIKLALTKKNEELRTKFQKKAKLKV